MVGSNAEFIEDSWQQTDKYGRSLGLVFCNDMFLKNYLLTNGHAEISTYFCERVNLAHVIGLDHIVF